MPIDKETMDKLKDVPLYKFWGRLLDIPKLAELRPKDIQNYWINDGPGAIFIILYIMLNLLVFFERVLYYMAINRAVFNVLSFGVVFARASAAAIKLNCAVLLVPVLRNFLSWLRGTFVGTYLPIDKAIVFHKKIAWAVCFFALMHMTAHFFNFISIELADEDDLESIGLSPATALELGWTTLPGITGHTVVFIMLLMYSSAIESVRRPYFEVFWYTHHLFILFYLLLAIHGAAGLLEPPTFYIWVFFPCLAYIIERTIRLIRGNKDTILLLSVQHPSDVIELQMKKSSFKYKPGQYIFLNCPFLARHEWHPFTLTSAPEEDFISVHIRVVGDWTGALRELLNPEMALGVVRENMLTAPNGSPILRVDGPFGTASEEVFKFNNVMLIGGGIGVTPFASILKSVRYRLEALLAEGGEIGFNIMKVYFFWISRDKNCFEWFYELLSALEAENIGSFLEINTYITGIKPKQAEEMGLNTPDEDGRDRMTGLSTPAHYGRPNFDAVYEGVSEKFPGEHVGVFFCGPRVLSKMLAKYATKWTRKSDTKFHYHKENF